MFERTASWAAGVWDGFRGRPPLTPEAFTAYVAARFRAALPDAVVTVMQPLALETIEDGRRFEQHLSHVFSECLLMPRWSRETVERFVAIYADEVHKADPAPLQPNALRTVVRSTADVEAFTSQWPDAPPPAAQRFAGDLWLWAVEDRPATLAHLNENSLAPLGLSVAEAIEVGKRNMLFSVQQQIESLRVTLSWGSKVLIGDSYRSSLIAFHDLWAPLAQTPGGDIFVAATDWDTMLMCKADTRDAAHDMGHMAEYYLERASRPISADVFIWRSDGWRVV